MANGSLLLNTTSSRVWLGDSVILQPQTFTIEAWFKTSYTAKMQNIYRWRLYGASIEVLAGGTLSGWIFGTSDLSSQRVITTSINVADNQWHHVALVRDASNKTLKLYLDGQLVGSITTPEATVYYGSGGAAIGGTGDDPTWAPFQGYLAEVRLWNVARTESEINSYKNRVLHGDEEGLIGYWRLNDLTGNVARDLSPSKINGTIYGGIWSTTEKPPVLIIRYLFQDGNDIKQFDNQDLVPSMTSNTTPAPIRISASSWWSDFHEPWTAFDNQNPSDRWSGWATAEGTPYGWISVDFGTPKVVGRYAITIRAKLINIGEAPKDWTFEGSSDGTNWIVLDTRTDQTGWTIGERREYTVGSPGSYLYYRFNFTANNGIPNYVAIGEIDLYEHDAWFVVGQTPVTEEMFKTYGIDEPPVIPDNYLSQLTNLQILVHVDEQYYTPNNMLVTALPKPRVVFPSNDISLSHVEKIESISISSNQTANGIIRIIVSVDGGQTWKTWQDGWVDIDPSDLSLVKANGIDLATFNTINSTDWSALIGDSKKIRFAYYLEQDQTIDTASVDKLQATFDLKGRWDIAIRGVDYKYSYPNSNTVRVTLLANGDYKITY